MNKLFFSVITGSALMLAASSSAGVIANKINTHITQSQNSHTIKEQEDLPIPNVFNYNLSNADDFMKYMAWCDYYTRTSKDYLTLSSIYSTLNTSYDENYKKWDDSKLEYVGTEGTILETGHTDSKQSLIFHATSDLNNYDADEQTLSSLSFSHQVTDSKSLSVMVKVSLTLDIKAIVENIRAAVETSTTGTWTHTESNTLIAPYQSIKVPGHSKITISYDVFNSHSDVQTWIQRKLNNSMIVGTTLLNKNSVLTPEFHSLGYWYNLMVGEHNDWIFKIPTGYLHLDKDNNIVGGMPTSFESDSASLTVTNGEAQPL